MRQLSKSLLVFVLVLFSGFVARANHIYGADFYYEYVSGNNYRIYLVLYGDCKNDNGRLVNAAPKVYIRNGNKTIDSITLRLTVPEEEVTPVCSRMKDSTQCTNPNYTIRGVQKFIYSGSYTFTSTSNDWRLYFDGSLAPRGAQLAGRAASITNIVGGSVMAMEAMLNNTGGQNSSPVLTTLPTPFYCINVAQQYNPGAVDKNGDSLSYDLVPGLNGTSGAGGGGGGTVTYVPPATATAPLLAATGTFSFSNTTGQLAFTPSAVQYSLLVQQITEYRNGVIVGTVMREMTIIVLSNCNPSSVLVIDTAGSSTKQAGKVNASTIAICQGSDSAQFTIKTINQGPDTVNISVSGLPNGANAAITGNNTPTPSVMIDWNLPGLPAGNYNFFITYKEDGCPLASQQTQAYTVTVARPNEITTSILKPTQCAHKAYVGYTLNYGFTPRTVILEKNGITVRQYKDTTGSFADSLDVGLYQISVSSPNLPCSTAHFLRVADSGIYPNRPIVDTVFYCLNDPSTALTAKVDSGATLVWSSFEGNHLVAAPTPKTDSAGIFRWQVAQRMKVCNSLNDTIDVFVTKRPTADFTLPESICAHDTATINFSGTIGVGPILDYNWNWGDGQVQSGQGAGPWRIYWYSTGPKTIKLVVAENKCQSFETEHSLIVRPIPFAGFTVGSEVCEYDTLRVTYTARPITGQTYLWSFQDADTAVATGAGPYLLRWHNSGSKIVKLKVDLEGCADTGMAEVVVRPAPEARILNPPGGVCIGDKIYLKASGGVTYAWQPADSILYNASGELYAQILKPTIYRVYVTSEYGCVDSAKIDYNLVEPCCNFSYPNAFTPNGDGRNDRFRVVTYGNQIRYELSIYNNWGQRVYYGLDAQEGWDGNFRGKPCEPGTYFYYLNATCFSGKQETHKGDLMLVR